MTRSVSGCAGLFTYTIMKTAIELIQEERRRQIVEKGWTEEHDDTHTNSELSIAAAAYAVANFRPATASFIWPWKTKDGGGYIVNEGFNTGQKIRDLIKAGALIVAEIERLQRNKTACASPADRE